MKEKINLLSKGIFEYGSPIVKLSQEELKLSVETDSCIDGQFQVDSANDVEVRAKIFSSSNQMVCQETDIIGISNTIHYHFDAGNMESGESVEGHISIISNGGEIKLPYKVTVRSPYCQSMNGEISSLDDFTELAQEHWHEAVTIFRSENFKRVFLVNKIHAHIYDKLRGSSNMNQAMEEFLYSLKRKSKLSISVTQREIIHNNLIEPLSDKLVIEKNTWGYQEIFVAAQGDFINVYKNRLTTQDFIGSYYELEYYLNPNYLRPGRNEGKIILSTFSQSIEIKLSCYKEYYRSEERPKADVFHSLCHIESRYMKLLRNQIKHSNWITETREDVDCCRNHSDDLKYILLEGWFLAQSGETESAKSLIEQLNAREIRRNSTLLYCQYLYVNAIIRNESDYTKYAIDRLREYYLTECTRWEVLWMLLQLDVRTKSDRLGAYKQIRREYESGCRSPLIYQEAINLLNDDPSVMRELKNFDIIIMEWGSRHQLLTRELTYQYADLVVREHIYHPMVLRTLMRIYKTVETREILAAICSMLIRGNMSDYSYNHWYAAGISQSLKLTRLYEYYMISLNEQETNELPSAVLYYFNYNNQLEWQKKAYLYRYVIEHRDSHQRIYQSYDKIMQAFTFEQLSKGRMDLNLSVLYNHYISKENINENLAKQLPNIMFKHMITCRQPKLRSIVVTIREINKEFIYPISNGRAYIDLFMDDYNIAFEDLDGNRYIRSIPYTMEKMMDETEFIRECYEMYPDNAMILMNRSERALKYQMIDDISIDIFKRTLKIESIRDEYRKNILKNLIDIYYENYEGETLEKYLLRLDLKILGSTERSTIIEYYIQRGFYERAFEAIREYGFEMIKAKRLMRMTSRLIRKWEYKEDPLLLETAYTSFVSGKYDEVILEYLNRYYMGTTMDYLKIWRAVGVFEVTAHQLEEKLLCQVLFTENLRPETTDVFESYYNYRPNIKIVRAYLAYSAYCYLIKGISVDERIFYYIEGELDQMDYVRDICCLALLHYLSDHAEGEQHSDFIRREVKKFTARGLILPWFKKFERQMEIPQELLDRVYVTYTTNPEHTVKVRYRIEKNGESGEWHEENMQSVFSGIFVSSWLLFADEQVIWQTLDDDGIQVITSEPEILIREVPAEVEPENGIDYINLMILEKDFDDYHAFCNTAESYGRKYAAAESFLKML